MDLNQTMNGYLDKLVRADVRIGRSSWPAFKVCGSAGMVLAIAVGLTLATLLGLSTSVTAGIQLSAILTFFGVILVTRIITGEELIIYYHHEIAVVAVTAILLWMLGQPVLPYLDIIILCIGTLLVCGRVGCLMAGCCHGTPHSWGVCYPAEPPPSGLSSHYVGVRLFPIQAVESLYVFEVVVVGCGLALSGQAPGEALGWYTVTYGLGRFCFEFKRGDPDRPYYWGFSQPQWISLVLIAAIMWAELTGTISLHLWHSGVAGLMAVMAVAVALRSIPKGITKHKIFHPRHIHEFAAAIQLASDLAVERCDMCKQSPATQDIHVARTYLGVQVSASRIKRPTGHIHHYGICYQSAIMSERAAILLSGLLLRIKHPSDSSRLIKGPKGVFHLLVHTPADSDALIGIVDELRDGTVQHRPSSSPHRRLEEKPGSSVSGYPGLVRFRRL